MGEREREREQREREGERERVRERERERGLRVVCHFVVGDDDGWNFELLFWKRVQEMVSSVGLD